LASPFQMYPWTWKNCNWIIKLLNNQIFELLSIKTKFLIKIIELLNNCVNKISKLETLITNYIKIQSVDSKKNQSIIEKKYRNRSRTSPKLKRIQILYVKTLLMHIWLWTFISRHVLRNFLAAWWSIYEIIKVEFSYRWVRPFVMPVPPIK
jgi:hypothetical protein